MSSEPWKGFQALCRDETGTVTGYVLYKIDAKFDGRRPAGVVTVDLLVGATPAVEARLWRYVCEIDWARKVVAHSRRGNELLPHWLTDGRAVVQSERSDFLWARPLDVAACLAGRTYAAPLDTTIEVVDPLGLSNGRWRVQTDGGGSAATVTTATGPADLTVPVATVGAVLFGSTSWWVLHATGGVDEHTAGALAAAEAAFHSDDRALVGHLVLTFRPVQAAGDGPGHYDPPVDLVEGGAIVAQQVRGVVARAKGQPVSDRDDRRSPTRVRARPSSRSRRAACATPTCTTARAASTTTSRSCSATRPPASSSRSAPASPT